MVLFMNTSAPTPLNQLTDLIGQRDAVMAQLAQIEAKIRQAAAYCDRSRVPRSVIADTAGISQPTLRRWIAQATAEEGQQTQE